MATGVSPTSSGAIRDEDTRIEPPKGAKSPLWKHFGFVKDGEGKTTDPKHVRCKLCGRDVAYSGNTTNSKQHILNHHPEERPSTSGISSGGGSSLKQSTLEGQFSGPVNKMATSSKRARTITRRIAEFVARDLHPVSVVEGEGFCSLMELLEPSYTVPSRKTVSKELVALQGEVKAKIVGELDLASFVTLTMDFWSSFAVNSYLGVTCHCISSEWELKSYVLQTREVTDRHTGENIAHEIKSVVDEWSLHEKVVAATTDNGRNVVNAIVSHLQWQHVPCAAHTLQIAVRGGLQLQPVVEVLQRCRKLVGHFRHSYVAQNLLEEKQERLELPKHKLVQEVATRWNSTYEMLKRVIEQQAAISAVLLGSKKVSDRDLMLTSSELTRIECILKVLQPLSVVTTTLCEEKTPSASIVQPLIASLVKKHLLVTEIDPRIVSDLKATIVRVIEERFSNSDQQKLLLLCSILDPRFKSLKFLHTSERKSVIDHLHSILLENVETAEPSPKQQKTSDADDCELNLFDFSESSGSETSPPHHSCSKAEAELTQYLSAEQIPPSSDPLNWWRLNEHRFQNIARLARKYLAICGTSVPSERLFSTAGQVVTKRRASLHPDTVDCLLFLNKNM